MSAVLEIASPGAMATIQDLGRSGYRRFGVPRAGALDPGMLRIANALAGNPEAAPAIEFFVGGLSLRALDGPVHIAGAGDFTIEISGGQRRRTVAAWRSVILAPGEQARISSLRSGRFGIIAVTGLHVPPALGSASTYARAGLGGIGGKALAAGTRLVLPALPDDGDPGERALPRLPPEQADAPIRIVPGPQEDHFTAAAWETLLAAPYTVTRDADRMGIRLEGPPLAHHAGLNEIVSDATVPGSIQVPGNGQPIVLLADGQTAGGYPKIATVVSADLPRLANLAPGQILRFAAIDVEGAEALCRQCEHELRETIAGIVRLSPEGGVDLDALHAGNLVSGVVSALSPDPIPPSGDPS